MVLDGFNFQNLTKMRIDTNSGWAWISLSLLAKSVSFLVQQENKEGFLVVLDAPETNFSEMEIRKCSGLHGNCETVLRKVIFLSIQIIN